MYLQKTAENAVPGQLKQDIASGRKAVSLAGVKAAALPTGAKPVPVLRAANTTAANPVSHSVHTLTAAAGLPTDRLSASIVSFARFFSLPIKPELMAAIRQQAFSQTATQTANPAAAPAQTPGAIPPAPETPESLAKTREAFALAAAAAEGKGVELNPKGLGVYAEAIAPDWQKRDSGERDGRQHKRQNEGEKSQRAEPVSADELRKAVLESAEGNPLLAILNRLPGKDGRHWIVLPFDFERDGREYRVSMRVLLDRETPAVNQSGRMVLDITETAENRDAERRWLFALESAGAASVSGTVSRLTVYLQPELQPVETDTLAPELAGFLGIPAEQVFVKNRTDEFPCESSDCPDELLRSIYRAV